MGILKTAFALLTAIVFLAINARGEVPVSDSGSRAFIRSWLLCGPFPNPLAEGVVEYRHDETTLGMYTDYLEGAGGEAGVAPEVDVAFTTPDGQRFVWRRHDSTGDLVELGKIFADNQRKVAYAACRLFAAQPGEAILSLGSNDGVRAWLNGGEVWLNHRPRGAQMDEDLVPVTLRQGNNLLLLKIDQGQGGWGFYARVLDRAAAEEVVRGGPGAELELELETRPDAILATYGRVSRQRILQPALRYTASLESPAGETVASGEANLGEPVTFSRTGLTPGPYFVVCRLAVSSNGEAEARASYFEGESRVNARVYGADGQPVQTLVELLDENWDVVRDAVVWSGEGRVSILRPDLSPFYLRVLLESPALGKWFYIADNQGQGYRRAGAPADLDLIAEVHASLQHKIQTLVQDEATPNWLKAELQARLRAGDAAQTPAARHAAIALLSSAKTVLECPAGGAALWFSPSVEKVAQDEAVPVIPSASARVALARNEYESFQLVLNPSTDLKHLTVTATDFKSGSGQTLDASNIEVNGVHYIEIQQTSDYFGTEEPWPDALPPLVEQPDAAAGQNTPIWLTVFAPKTQAAGIYDGEIVIASDTGDVARVPCQIQVYDITLPNETHTETAYGVSPESGGYHGALSPVQADEVHDLYMQFCARHRITPYSPHARAGFEIRFEGEPARAVVDFTRFDSAMSRYIDDFKFTSFNMGGIPDALAGHARGTGEYQRLFKDAYTQIQEHLREKGWLDEAYWYWVDEPPRNEYARVKEGMDLLKEGCPDIRRLLTCNQDMAPIPFFHDSVNLWVPIMDRYDADLARPRQALGETVWWYVCTGPKAPYPNNFIDHPAMNHRVRFWILDSHGLDGSLYWSVTYWQQNPWQQAMSVSPEGGPWGNGDGRLLYPPRRAPLDEALVAGPVDSIRFASLRDGLEDREYLWLLARKAEGDPGAKAVLDRARWTLVKSMTCYEQNPLVFLAERQRIAAALESAR